MLKRFLLIFLLGLLPLSAKIIKTVEISDILPEIESETIVFLNLAEVVMDSETSLGSQPWRKFLKKTEPKMHDPITLLVFILSPVKAVETRTAPLIQEMQKQVPVIGLTSRGRTEWYGMKNIQGIDVITEKHLNEIDVDFSKSRLPSALLAMEQSEYYHEGILYATNSKDKGELLTEIFTKTGYVPRKVIFVDDKEDSLVQVERALDKIGIPFVGFAYSRTSKDRADFNIHIANVQLLFMLQNMLISDEEALKDIHYFEALPADEMLKYLLQQLPSSPLYKLSNDLSTGPTPKL